MSPETALLDWTLHTRQFSRYDLRSTYEHLATMTSGDAHQGHHKYPQTLPEVFLVLAPWMRTLSSGFKVLYCETWTPFQHLDISNWKFLRLQVTLIVHGSIVNARTVDFRAHAGLGPCETRTDESQPSDRQVWPILGVMGRRIQEHCLIPLMSHILSPSGWNLERERRPTPHAIHQNYHTQAVTPGEIALSNVIKT